MQDRIQLKREEVVGEGVALSDINPVTNTKSVDDDSAGVPLDVTIERLWQAINNSLSRVVNSVNGRSGIVVVTADDVGLGNVTNVSYGTIQEWVIKELADQFGIKHLMLFDTEAEMNAAMEGWRRDTGHANVPFYIRNNSTDDMRSSIGYFAWDDATAMLVPVKKAIDTIGYADNSIIYNESINGRELGNGGIGVNIWSGEDALKIFNASAVKSQGGLMIDKDKIAPHVYFYNGAYGNDASEGDLAALVYTDDGVTTVTKHKLRINVKGITITDPTVDTCQTFKKNDIIVCNFSDNGYRNNDGSLKSNVVPELVCRESMIGAVISVPDGVDPSSPYVIDFFPIKPYVGMGLKYYEVHTDATTNKKSTMIGIDLLTGKMTSAFIDANVSGINAFSSPDRYDVTISDMKTNHTVTPVGRFSTSISGSNSAFISPDFSMNVVPSNIFGNTTNSPITNWPPKTPGESTNGNSRPIGNQSFVGVNLLKKVDTTNKTAYNMSGLRIIDPLNSNDTITNNAIGKSDNDTTDKFATDAGTTSGGLMVNVGKFLEIGTNVGDDATRYDGLNGHPQYYAGGKVNVRVNEVFFKDDDNRLDLNLSHYSSYDGIDPNNTLAGGLTYTPGDDSNPDVVRTPGLTINRGMGLRMSHYDRFGKIPPKYSYRYLSTEPEDFDPTKYYKSDGSGGFIPGEAGDTWGGNTWFEQIENHYDENGFLTVSIFDPQFTEDFDPGRETEDFMQQAYGGLRYIVSDSRKTHNTSAIGLRVNEQQGLNGHALRLGSKAVGIDEHNVVGVQLYRESSKPISDDNPLNIKNWDEFALYKYVKMPWMKEVEVSTKALLPSVGDLNTIYYVKEDIDENNQTWISRRYIWTSDPSIEPEHGKYELMFEYYDDYDQLPSSSDVNPNKAYVVLKVNNADHTIRGYLYQWETAYHVEIPESWVPESQGVPGHYNQGYNPPYGVNAVTATSILQYYAMTQTSHEKGYYRNGTFWYGPTDVSGEMIKKDGVYYEDITTPLPHMYYIYHSSTDTYDAFDQVGERSICREDIIPYDLNHDGAINAVDASIALLYYADFSTHRDKWPDDYWDSTRQRAAKPPRDFLAYYLTTYEGVKEYDNPKYVIMRSSTDGSFIPGLDIDVNEYQGITTVLNGDIKKSISVKLFDKSAGYNYETANAEDLPKLGGLRFTTEGFLSVRVNESNTYNATTQLGRAGADVQANLLDLEHGNPDGYKGLEQNLGSKGLMVYSNNVLGIQLTHDARSEMDDNGELCFDEYGSLHISPQYHGGGGGGELLTITDGTTTVEYNGSVAQTITLGPGLKLEPDPTPNP